MLKSQFTDEVLLLNICSISKNRIKYYILNILYRGSLCFPEVADTVYLPPAAKCFYFEKCLTVIGSQTLISGPGRLDSLPFLTWATPPSSSHLRLQSQTTLTFHYLGKQQYTPTPTAAKTIKNRQEKKRKEKRRGTGEPGQCSTTKILM